MADPRSPFESNVDAVLGRLEDLDHRLRALEARVDAAPMAGTDFLPSGEPTATAERFSSGRTLSASVVASLTGRTCLVLGGGYLLRALADFGILPLPLAVALGQVYALAWFFMVDRAGASRKAASATFHGLAASALLFPLLFEVSVKYRLLPPWTVAAALTAVAALGITVGWRRRLQGVVWIVSTAAIITVVAFLRAGQDIAPFALHLVLLAGMTYWVADTDGWWRVRWPAALAADGAIVWLAMHSVQPQDSVQATVTVVVALALFLVSFGSFAVRMLVLGRDVIPFEIVQSGAALLVGYGGAAYIARASNLATRPYGLVGLVFGASAYGVAFWRDASTMSRRNFYYFSTMAIALVIAGGSLALPAPLAASVWIILAPAGVLFGRRHSHGMLGGHGAAYLVAAAVASGLLAQVGYGLLAPATWPWREVTPIALAALAAAAVCSAVAPLGVRTLRTTNVVMSIAGRRTYLGVPRAIALAILVLGLSGIVVTWAVSSLGSPAGLDRDGGIVATVRTITLASAAILMAMLARNDRVREAGWLIYPLLIAAGLKIVLEDFRHSAPATLFVALVVYGSALIAAPRIASKS